MKNFLILLVCGLVLFLAGGIGSCKKEEPESPLWFSNYTRFYYDYSDDTIDIPNYRRLSVYPTSTANELFFEEMPTDTAATSWQKFFMTFGNGILISKPDGLYSQACKSCGMGLLCFHFDFLSIPAHPEKAGIIPLYGCAYSDEGSIEVLHTDTAITVPAGTYRSFCLLHPNGDRTYWNRDFGLIMYQQYQHDRAYPFRLLSTLKLRSMQ